MREKRLPLILGGAAAALVLLLAAVIPALFVRPDVPETAPVPLTTAERAELFRLYWAEDVRCTAETCAREDFTPEELAPSEKLTEALHAEYAVDRGTPLVESAGEHFYLLRGADGREMRMREYYEQASGDWSSWFRVYTDIDTQEILFFYQSCKCLKNERRYDPAEIGSDAWTLSAMWADTVGCESYLCLGGTDGKVSAAYVRGEQAVYYDTSYTTYTSPEYVIDFRMVIQPPPEAVPETDTEVTA